MTYTQIANINDIEEGKGKLFSIQGLKIAIFKNKNEIFALEDQCTHRGGPLNEGNISEGCVICPWHGFEFDLSTGNSTQSSPIKKYQVKIQDNKILLDI